MPSIPCALDRNRSRCACTYGPCARKGRCCECIEYHRRLGELPGCLFPPEAEATWDRSRAAFIAAWSRPGA